MDKMSNRRGASVCLTSRQRNKSAADRVPDGNDHEGLKHQCGKISGERKVEHVGNTVLESAQDKDHDREKNDDDFSGLIFDALETVGGNEHEHAAENAQYEKADYAVTVLDEAEGACLGLQGGAVTRERNHSCEEKCTDKVAEPYDSEESPVARLVVDEIADFAREKVEAEVQDGKQPESEKEGAENLIVARKVGCAAKADA